MKKQFDNDRACYKKNLKIKTKSYEGKKNSDSVGNKFLKKVLLAFYINRFYF